MDGAGQTHPMCKTVAHLCMRLYAKPFFVGVIIYGVCLISCLGLLLGQACLARNQLDSELFVESNDPAHDLIQEGRGRLPRELPKVADEVRLIEVTILLGEVGQARRRVRGMQHQFVF